MEVINITHYKDRRRWPGNGTHWRVVRITASAGQRGGRLKVGLHRGIWLWDVQLESFQTITITLHKPIFILKADWPLRVLRSRRGMRLAVAGEA